MHVSFLPLMQSNYTNYLRHEMIEMQMELQLLLVAPRTTIIHWLTILFMLAEID